MTKAVDRSSPCDWHSTLKLFGKNSKRYFLVDTGAEISVYPANGVDRLNKSHVTLRAANNSFINTYGFKQLVLDFGLLRPLTRILQVADVNRPIFADFLLQHKLLVDLAQKRLVDTQNGTRVMAEKSTDTSPSIQHVSINSKGPVHTVAGRIPNPHDTLHKRRPC